MPRFQMPSIKHELTIQPGLLIAKQPKYLQVQCIVAYLIHFAC